jgi:hypothetical protein
MKLILRVEWPSNTHHWQILASCRKAEDPMADAGWWIGIIGDELAMGGGLPFSEGHMRFRAYDKMMEFVVIEDLGTGMSYGWSDEPKDMLGVMFTQPTGDTIHLGWDPQQPVARWTGSVEEVKFDSAYWNNVYSDNQSD